MVQVPVATSVSVPSLSAQGPPGRVLKPTGSPDEAVATSANAGAPRVRSGKGAKAIV